MSEERKQKARENARRYYQKNKEKVLAKQKEYVKKKYATDEEFRKKTNERSRKYAQNNIEKVREMKRNWANKHYNELREKGLLPLSKKEIIEQQKQEIDRLNNIIDTILEFSFFKEECPLNFEFGDKKEEKSQDIFYEDEWCEQNCDDNYKKCWLKYFDKLKELKEE